MADVALRHGFIITMDDSKRLIEDGTVIVEDGRIAFVGKSDEASKLYGEADLDIDASNKIIMPGMVNVHNHMPVYHLRNVRVTYPPPGMATVDKFGDLLTRVYWPRFEETATREEAYYGTLAMSMDMVRAGVTTTSDLMEVPNDIPEALDWEAKAAMEVGIRAVISFEASQRLGVEHGYKGLEANIEFIKKWNSKPDSRIRGMFGVHAPFSSSPEYFRKVRELADEYKAGIQLHVAQSPYEVNLIKKWYDKKGSIDFLHSLGFLKPDVIVAHCIYVYEDELNIIQRTGINVAFNVKSNMRGGHGIAPVVELLRRGVNVAYGLDGGWSDMFEFMMISAYLLRVHHLDRSLITPMQALEMATINGAKALGLNHEIGSLEPGKRADIIVIDIDKPRFKPVEDKLSLVANYVRGFDVEYVFIDGELISEKGRVLKVDEEEAYRKIEENAYKFRQKAEETPVSPPWKPPWMSG